MLARVTFAPASVAGGAATGTITFGSVTDGAIVSLTSSDPAVVRVPTEMLDNPLNIAVRSNFGGSATSAVRG